MRKAAVAFLVN